MDSSSFCMKAVNAIDRNTINVLFRMFVLCPVRLLRDQDHFQPVVSFRFTTHSAGHSP